MTEQRAERNREHGSITKGGSSQTVLKLLILEDGAGVAQSV
jgi:hypothetical protein